jgi:putative endonuclease
MTEKNIRSHNKNWYIYILECSDGSLYTGITTDVNRRLSEHNSGSGAKYTRTRTPVKLRALFEAKNRSEASKEEYRIKKLSKSDKLKLL